MFDCSGPTLVFVTQTHHPILEHHTGYIFALYDVHFHKAKELFFQHIAEAQVFALYREARLEMNPDAKPDRVTALEYVLSGEDASQYIGIPTGHNYEAEAATRKARRRQQKEAELEAALAEMEAEQEEAVLLDAEVGGIDFFGEE